MPGRILGAEQGNIPGLTPALCPGMCLRGDQKLQEQPKQSPRHLSARVCLLIGTDKADDGEIN